MNINVEEKTEFSERRVRWLNYLTNSYYNGTLDLINLGLTVYILIFNVHIDIGNLSQ